MNYDSSQAVAWETIELKINGSIIKYPLLVVKIWGKQTLVSMLKLMNQINKATNDVKSDYISLTDFTKLDVGFLMESMISLSMSRSLKTLIGVYNKAKISFVLFGENPSTQKLKKKLISLNNAETEFKYNYNYNYCFVESKDQIKANAEKILSGE